MTTLTAQRTDEAQGTERIQWRAAFRAIRRLIADSERTEEVFNLIEALGAGADRRLFERFRGDPAGRALLAARPDLLAALSDRETLRALPDGSLGRAYAQFMDEADLDASGLVEASEHGRAASEDRTRDSRNQARDESDARDWTGARLRDSHDLWHVLTGYGRDEAGEVSLLAFTWAQTRNRGIGLIVIVGAVIGCFEGGLGWPLYLRCAYRRGVAAQRLQLAPFERWLARPLADVRHELSIEAPEIAHPEGIAAANRGETPEVARTAAT